MPHHCGHSIFRNALMSPSMAGLLAQLTNNCRFIVFGGHHKWGVGSNWSHIMKIRNGQDGDMVTIRFGARLYSLAEARELKAAGFGVGREFATRLANGCCGRVLGPTSTGCLLLFRNVGGICNSNPCRPPRPKSSSCTKITSPRAWASLTLGVTNPWRHGPSK